MSRKFFIAGTDTEVGKTHVSELLLRAAHFAGMQTLGLKPVAAGAEVDSGGHVQNEDALRLMAASSCKLPYSAVNPVCLADPVSPHIAAAREKTAVGVKRILKGMQTGLNCPCEFMLVEGAGGWRVPINETETMADLARALSFPVILVVGMRLGCINHALLTVEAILNDGLSLAGWVANQMDADMSALDENIATLEAKILAPRLGFVAHGTHTDDKHSYSQFNMLFG